MIPYSWLEQANDRIRPHIQKTPLTYDSDRQLHLKWENHQVTGSFKARGALNKILSLHDWELERGLVTASAGNHGQGVALAARIRHSAVIVFASAHALPNKLQAMRELGAEIHLVQGGYGEAEQAGITYARNTGATWISPYNDGIIIAGQGTIALEILSAQPELSQATWIVPAGGGGLISGIGSALQHFTLAGNLVAVQSEASPYLHELYYHGTQEGVVELDSLADGLAGPVEAGSVTIPMVRNLVSEFILVSEAEIRHAIKYAWLKYHERIEGSAAASLAAVISGKVENKPSLVILTGGNIPDADHRQIIEDPQLNVTVE